MQRPCVSFCSASPSPRGSRGPGASTQAGPRGRLGRKACGNLRRLPLFLRVHFSSLSLRPNGSLAHKNNTNPSAGVERDGGEAWSSLVPRLAGGRGSPPSSVSSGGAHPQVFPLLLSGLCLLRPERPGCERDLHPPRPERLASSFWCLASRLP